MKIPFSTRSLLWASILTAAAGAGIALRAAEEKTAARPPLNLQVDNTPVDRDAFLKASFSSVVKKAAPSVVNVSSSKKVRASAEEFFNNDPIFRRFFGGQGMGQMRPQTQHSLGSGVIVSSDGYILTNNHVVADTTDVQVSIGDPGKEYKASIVGRDTQADIAVLKINASGLTPATLGDSDQLQQGDVVFAIGDPFGVGQSVTHGIVSATGRNNLGIETFENFIQTDAPINPGNSGGPLLDSAGRVVGINTAILTGGGQGSVGVGFAIPINLVRSLAEQLIRTGKVVRGYIGVTLQTLTPDIATQLGVSSGALVADVEPGSPGEKAGLKSLDVITKINGKPIDNGGSLSFIVSGISPGAEVAIEYVRDGKAQTTTARLGTRPEQSIAGNDSGGGNGGDNVGVLNHVAVSDITPDIREQLQLPNSVHGAVVTSVDPDSASAAAGLQEGDVIVSLNGKKVRDADEAVKLSADIKGPKVVVGIWRDHHTHFVVVDESA